MGERLLCKQEVDGSIPFTSTRIRCARKGIRDQKWIGRSFIAGGFGGWRFVL